VVSRNGWLSRSKKNAPSLGGERLSLTSPFIGQDFVGIIMKVQFNKKTEMFSRNDIIRELSKPEGWRLPHERWELDGKGKKLLISEPKTRAISIEAEVLAGGANKRTDTDPNYPFSNYIKPGSIMAFAIRVSATDIDSSCLVIFNTLLSSVTILNP
jgi:hypothetical protein